MNFDKKYVRDSHDAHHKRGFTLVEVLVALAIFVVVVLTSIGSLTSMSAANVKSQTTQIIMNNLNFAVESMARGMRVGFDYNCGAGIPLNEPNSCPTQGASSIAFQNPRGEIEIYRLSNNLIEHSKDGGATFLGITAPEIVIENLQFYVGGAERGDGLQPKVLIIVDGTAGTETGEQTSFNIQTTVSQRLLDS